MKVFFCSEFFFPSVGGVQNVLLNILKNFKKQYPDIKVEILTSYVSNRKKNSFQGYQIKDFKIYGNYIQGITGERYKFLNYVKKSKVDIIFIYAAQQWTFDIFLDTGIFLHKKNCICTLWVF